MWVEEEINAKGQKIYRFREEYEDPLTGKRPTVSVIYPKNNQRIRRKALLELNELIEERLRVKSSNITFGELIDDWLVDYKTTVKIGTYVSVKSKIKQLGELKDILLPELTAAHLNRFLRSLKQKGHSKSSVNSYGSMLRSIVNFGINYGEIVDTGVYSGIKIPAFREQNKTRNIKYLEQEELDSLVKQLRELGYEEVARMALLQTYTGTRNSELIAINYEESINWEDKTILIERTYVPSAKEYNSPKNSEIRTIHFNQETERLLREQIQYTKLKTLSGGLSREPILFKNSQGNPLTSNSLWHIFQKVNIPDKEISTHIFRHTFITRAIEQNIPIHLIAEHVGDKIETIDEHYRHFSKEMGEQLKNELKNMSFGN